MQRGGKKAFIEVKGVTLEEDGVCLFPDAPSERAVRHIEELIKAKKKAMRQSSFRDPDEGSSLFYSKSKDTAGVCRGIEKSKGGRCEDLGVRL